MNVSYSKAMRIMKKNKIILATILALGLSLNAQMGTGYGGSNDSKSDRFFTSNFSEFREGTSTTESWGSEMPTIVGHALNSNQDAALGSGLLVLAGMGLAYGLKKRKNS